MAVALKDGFEYEGFAVSVVGDGAAALDLVRETAPDIVVLDVMLPKMNGLEVCRQIRAGGNQLPIIMLTARGQEIDKVLGLKTGADDYITKPFSFLELMARVEAVLRRTSGGSPVETYSFGDVVVNFKRREITKAGAPVDLSPREFRLLQYFIEHRGEVVERDHCCTPPLQAPLTRTVDIHVAKLRSKLEHPEPLDCHRTASAIGSQAEIDSHEPGTSSCSELA
jgi:DNA-binding response OmpR family regulator